MTRSGRADLLLIGAYRDNEVSPVSSADAEARARSARPER